MIVFVVVATALHTTESSVSGLIERINQEIDKVDVPSVNPPDVNTQNAPNQSGNDASGGTAPPDQ